MEKIDLVEILKDCPTGMELDCTIWDNVKFDHIDMTRDCPIYITIKGDGYEQLTEYGQWNHSPNAKCVIFPKGKTTWEGFHRPFKDGDILFYKHKSNNIKYIFIYKRRVDMHYLLQYCGWFSEKPYLSEQFNAKERIPLYENDDIRFATKEEKEKLFKAIKDNGYQWNPETKTLEKLVEPKFKVGDRIKKDKDPISGVITNISDDGSYKVEYKGGGVTYVYPAYQDDWELVPDKFNISTLKPFDKVLVRSNSGKKWTIDFFGFINEYKRLPFVCVGDCVTQCIPYEGNEHLLGTTNDCDEYFKTWE